MLFERVAIIGVGLIGGSFALALKAAGACNHVVGAGRNAANVKLAQERGIVDSIAPDAVAAAHGADLVLVAAPVAQFPKIFRDISSVLNPKTIVTDAGSTKRGVIAAARSGLGRKVAQFVPAHPIAGAEKSGAVAAAADLFRGKRVILTPLPENADSAVRKADAAWSACGARVTRMAPEAHDALLAAVSHLPHLLAFALVHGIAGRENPAELFSLAAGGFRDFTRIASSHPEMWRDICMANRDRLLQELSAYEDELLLIRKLLEAGDAAGLEKLFAEARAARDKWIASS
ncbi:MAG TPA: prephenate dehydrogenase/arogenate dehydrogenase family protein [Burkholderiales bacterium]|jgi:prephenate dehydrogenase|nr:prephenate dehydrogenase/arogenate dehydrogenase family protein [Burkholderiales bacterium]